MQYAQKLIQKIPTGWGWVCWGGRSAHPSTVVAGVSACGVGATTLALGLELELSGISLGLLALAPLAEHLLGPVIEHPEEYCHADQYQEEFHRLLTLS